MPSFVIFVNFGVHPKCNRLNSADFKKLVETDESEVWSCYKCNCTLFPLNTDESTDGHCNSDPPLLDHLVSRPCENSETLDCKYYDSMSFNTKIRDIKPSSSFFSSEY